MKHYRILYTRDNAQADEYRWDDIPSKVDVEKLTSAARFGGDYYVLFSAHAAEGEPPPKDMRDWLFEEVWSGG